LLALIEATNVIRRGHADVMLVGGLGSRLSITPITYRSDENLSHRNDQPEAASRPFELDRDGMVNGEGSAAVLLESSEHALARGAHVMATISGYGQAYAGQFDPRQSPPRGICSSIQQALASAGIAASDLCHVNAHGLSTQEHDRWEAAAIADTLGPVRVTAPKSYFGNLGAGGGMAELLVTLFAFEKGFVPPTLNYHRPDPLCPVTVPREAVPSTNSHALVLSQSTMGQTVAVVLGKAM
jgi:3-oxoacyl-[acyl-carrier-protein] synthase II